MIYFSLVNTVYLFVGMCSVLDLSNEPGLQRIIDYKNYWRLDNEDEVALVALCIALNPMDLNGESDRISMFDKLYGLNGLVRTRQYFSAVTTC